MENQEFHLHTYFRSSCAARIRIACHLKSIPLKYSYINLVTAAQLSAEYKATNPSASVPTLTITSPSSPPIVIRQSIAILEFLEEAYPDKRSLLPKREEIVQRAKVRELVGVIACDTQPPSNLRILKSVKTLVPSAPDEAAKKWACEIMSKGLLAYDVLAEKYAGKYSVGESITMADVCLMPAVDGALRWGVDVEKLGSGTVWRVYEALRVDEAFVNGGWRAQEDTPQEFRVAN